MGCDIHPYVEVRRNGVWERSGVKVPNDRDYFAFGKLANVRNGTGFAGCDMGDPVRPIAEPRGLPTDTTIKDNSDVGFEDPAYVWLGDHSHSWVTLEELLAIDYDALVTQRGKVSPKEYAEMQKWKRPPREWCGDTNQADYVKVEWKQPLSQVASLLPKIIVAICHLGKPEDVRLVFGFDS